MVNQARRYQGLQERREPLEVQVQRGRQVRWGRQDSTAWMVNLESLARLGLLVQSESPVSWGYQELTGWMARWGLLALRGLVLASSLNGRLRE